MKFTVTSAPNPLSTMSPPAGGMISSGEGLPIECCRMSAYLFSI